MYEQVLAKFETRQSLFEFQDIASKADGVIMSRGNLGLDVLPEKMALIQVVYMPLRSFPVPCMKHAVCDF